MQRLPRGIWITLLLHLRIGGILSCHRVDYTNRIQERTLVSPEVRLFFPEKKELPPLPVYNAEQGCSCGLLPPDSGRPWAGILSSNKRAHSCAVSLLNKRYVVSSASCVCQILGNSCESKELSKYSYFEPPENTLWVTFPSASLHFYVKGCYIHGLYNFSRGSDDIALLSLNQDITAFKPGVLQPICLPGQKEPFNDLDCEILPALHRIRCGVTVNPTNHSYLTSFKSSPDTNLPCLTNSIGPMKYEPCVSKFQNFSACQQFRSPFSVPLSTKCMEAFKSLNTSLSSSDKASSMFLNIKTDNASKITCPNKELTPSEIIRNQIKYGWCYTCTKHMSQCRDWGYCSKECSHKDRGPGPFLLEKPVHTFTSRDLGLCGDIRKQFCASGQLLLAPSASYDIQGSKSLAEDQSEIKDDDGSNYGLIEDLDDYIVYSKKDMSLMCNEHSGGSIWKKFNLSVANEHLQLAVLTGIVSRPGRVCNTKNEEAQRGIPIHTRIHNYLPWILSVSSDGRCKAHKDDLYVNKLNGSNLEANMGLTRQFYCTLQLNGTEDFYELLNPNSEKYMYWKKVFDQRIEFLKEVKNIWKTVFFEFTYTPDQNISAAFALITSKKTSVPTLQRDIRLKGLSIQVMMNEVAMGLTPEHLHLSWKWSGSELNVILKEQSKSPVMKLSVGVSRYFGHLSSMRKERLQLYRAHVNFKAKDAKVLNVVGGNILATSSKVEILELSLEQQKHGLWMSTFGFQTKDVKNLGVFRNTSFCFLVQLHEDIRKNPSHLQKFPIATQHCFLDLDLDLLA